MKKLSQEKRNNAKKDSVNLTRRGFLHAALATGSAPLVANCLSARAEHHDLELGRPFWGDLHCHSALSDGNGSAEDNFTIAESQLDFWCLTDHAIDPEVFTLNYKEHFGREILNDNWGLVQQLCREREQPGKFVPFLGYEWTNFGYGHHNVYYYDYDQPIRMPATLPELYDELRDLKALAIPHHTAYPVGICGKNWDYFDERLSPFAEIYSMHGSSEEPDGPRPLMTGGSWMGPGGSGGSVQEGLARGHKFGIMASSDSHGNHPGAYDIGLMGVYADGLTRPALWKAFHEKRLFGVTGDRIVLDFSLNGTPMGSVAPRSKERQVNISAVGWDRFDRVEVIKNNAVLHTFDEPAGGTGRTGQTRFRFFVEWGWDNEDYHDWQGKMTVKGGRIIEALPCFRGNAASRLGRGIKNLNSSKCSWDSKTRKVRGGMPVRYFAEAIAFEVECSEWAEFQFDFSCSGLNNSLTLSSQDILAQSFVKYMEYIPETNDGAYWHKMESHSKFKIHRGWPTKHLTLNLSCEDSGPEPDKDQQDFYYVRLFQRNGQRAWSSPVWI